MEKAFKSFLCSLSGIFLVTIDEDVDAFLDNLYLLNKLYSSVKNL